MKRLLSSEKTNSQQTKWKKSKGGDIELPMNQVLFRGRYDDKDTIYVVLVATGSFNPPTLMHLRMFELARSAFNAEDNEVAGAYMSPVSDAHKKQGLVSGVHRLRMCELACNDSDFIMVDPWEVNQSTDQCTLTILKRVESYFPAEGCYKVMLLCGSDLLQSFSTPGLWIPGQVRTICRDYGISLDPQRWARY